MEIRIAIVTDIHSIRDRPPVAAVPLKGVSNGIHAPGSQNHPERRGELAENLLLCVVNRFNRWIKPDIEFVEKCVNAGVKLCLSSDSHNMYEFGELWPHLKMLEKIGVSASDFQRVLL